MKRRSTSRFPLVGVIIAAALIAAVVLFLERRVPIPDRPPLPGERSGESRTGTAERTVPPPRAKAVEQEKEKTKPQPTESVGRPVAVIIDDIGYDLEVVRQLAQIEVPLAFAVLPFTPHAAEAARRLHAAGKEILLHLPMEPRSYPAENPGPGALMTDMDDDAIRSRLAEALAAVPHAIGVNNHMGSRFMEDEARLKVVMEELSKRGLFFVDSRTTPASRGREAAAGTGVPFAARTVFIDHKRGYESALANLVEPPGGRKGRPVLMIGHPHPETVRALRKFAALRREGKATVIPPSAYLKMQGAGEKQYATGRKTVR